MDSLFFIRNKVIYDYFCIDLEVIWKTIHSNLPVLYNQIKQLLQHINASKYSLPSWLRACCIAPSITSPLPGMPQGKPAGVRCAQLMTDNRCAVFGTDERPSFCAGLKPSAEMCGDTREQAIRWLNKLELATRPPL